jgi:hypothetical protein
LSAQLTPVKDDPCGRCELRRSRLAAAVANRPRLSTRPRARGRQAAAGSFLSLRSRPRGPSARACVFSCSGCLSAGLVPVFHDPADGPTPSSIHPRREPRWSPDGQAVSTRLPDDLAARGDGSDTRQLTHLRPATLASVVGGRRARRLVRSACPPAGRLPHRAPTMGRDQASTCCGCGQCPTDRMDGGLRNDVRERMWTANADESNRRRLGPKSLVGREPRWSPEGRRVAFIDFDAGRFRLLDLGTGRARTLLTFGSSWAHSWSPDGKWLALMRTTPVDPAACEDPRGGCESLQLDRQLHGRKAEARVLHARRRRDLRDRLAAVMTENLKLNPAFDGHRPHGRRAEELRLP